MYCCVECFYDKCLKSRIKEQGNIGNCDVCGRENIYCIEPEKLADDFLPIIDLYAPVEELMSSDCIKEGSGDFLEDKLQEDWEIFSYEYCKSYKDLLNAMFRYDYKMGPPQFLSSKVENKIDFWGIDEEFSGKKEEQWKQFTNELKHHNRYFPKNKIDLNELGDIFSFFEFEIPENTELYRARKNDTDKKFPPSMMGKPPVEFTKNGRANPKGISYLYLASDETTCVSETRPRIDEKLTIGIFLPSRNLKVIDLRNPVIDSPFRFGSFLQPAIQYLGFLRVLGIELSKPVNPDAEELEYLASQYLCEFIKTEKCYDGVAYKSSLAEGYNLAIFDDDKLKCIRTKLAGIKYNLIPLK